MSIFSSNSSAQQGSHRHRWLRRHRQSGLERLGKDGFSGNADKANKVVEGLVHVLANELGKRKVTVNAVAPGPVATELFTKGKSQ